MLGLSFLAPRWAAADFRDSFESPETVWRLADSDCPVRLLTHTRTTSEFRSGRSSEHLRILAGHGSYIHLIMPIPLARAISDLTPSLWVKSNEVGMQLMARVVLPRSRFPKSQKTMVGLLRGDSYTRGGAWQQLRIPNVERLLQRETQQLRSKYGPQIDPREAYIDAIVLNAFGRPGTTDLWLDDLELAGFAQPPNDTVDQQAGPFELAGSGRGAVSGRIQLVSFDQEPEEAALERISLQGTTLQAGSRPLMPRVIDWNGESFEMLHRLGFNGVRLGTPPTAAQSDELSRLQMWCLTPPWNRADELGRDSDHGTTRERRLLGVELGRELTRDDREYARGLAAQARSDSRTAGVPLVAGGSGIRESLSPHADIFIDRPALLGTTRSLPIYLARLTQESAEIARRPSWMELPSEPGELLTRQTELLAPPAGVPALPDLEQLRLLSFLGVAHGYRGVLCASRTRLDIRDREARAAALHWLNEELSWIEPWCAGGTYLGTISHDKAQIGVWDTEPGRLLVIVRTAPHDVTALGPLPREPISLVTRYPKNSVLGYRLSPHGLLPAKVRREAGGLRVTLDDASRIELVVLTADPVVVNHFARQLTDRRESLAKLRLDVTTDRLRETDDVLRVAKSVSADVARLEGRLDDARANTRQCARFLASHDYPSFDRILSVAGEQINEVRWTLWRQSVQDNRLGENPGSLQFATLPHLWLSSSTTGSISWQPRELPVSDFESLADLLERGWRQRRGADAGVLAELSPDTPHGGQYALHLRMVGAASGSGATETPIAIVSPPLRVEQGQWLKLQGWIRIPEPLSQGEGAVLTDSIGGAELARRFYRTDGWERFVLFRAVPESADWQFTLALNSPGDVYFDDLSLEFVDVGDK